MGITKSSETSETKTSIAPRSGTEQSLIELFSKIAQEAGGQLGDLDISSLLSGQGLVPSASDKQLVSESIGATGDMARRQLEETVRGQNLNLDEVLSSRGIQGSSIESVQRGLVARGANDQFANILDSVRREGANALLQLPYQRAGIQLSANQALMQRLGLGNNLLTTGLQERMANATTTGKGSSTGLSAQAKDFSPTSFI